MVKQNASFGKLGEFMTKAMDDKEFEQKHLDKILKMIRAKKAELSSSIKSAEGEAQDLNSHFFDDVKLDYDGYATSKIVRAS